MKQVLGSIPVWGLLFLLAVVSVFWSSFANANPATLRLEEIGDQDITPKGSRGVRPDTVKIGDAIYVNYLQLWPQRNFRIVKWDLALTNSSIMDAVSGMAMPTDARMSAGDEGRLWYPYESVFSLNPRGPGDEPSRIFDPPTRNFVNLARYKIDAEGLTLEQSKMNVLEGSYLAPGHIPPVGTMLSDDPTPFFADGKYYVFLKSFSPDLYARVYSKDFVEIDAYRLDLAEVADHMTVSVNSIVRVGKTPMLIAGLFDGPPIFPGTKTAIVAMPLTDDLKAAKGNKIILSRNNGYETYVSGARYENGKLYVVYTELSRDIHDRKMAVILKVFDTNSDYRILAAHEVYRGPTLDGHATVELAGDRVYVFYFTVQEHIRVRTFLWK
jgi:hypothetical protein